uniref:WD40 repeat n=1 Tax=Candidatus Kentrum sp. MB TaxID=2138164 RepID=A0A450XWX0_9GAMM|nr:MAG: WD40 repeat [Candidatus Kentron sp. MB]VFK76330.1 MAG: WD40 repeat [Candidatus Kentron sp. MB]
MKPTPQTDIAPTTDPMATQMATPMIDKMAEAGLADPYREPSPLFDFIERLGEAFSTMTAEGFIAALIPTVLGGLVVVFVAWLSLRAWSGLSKLFWHVVGRLGVLPGIQGFVVRGYLRRVRERFGVVRNIYLDREEELDLHRVFVPLTLARAARGDKQGSGQDVEQAIATPQTTREILTRNPRLVILGAPGSGKTTLLKALASGVSQHQWPEWRNLAPVFVSLRAFSRVPEKPELYDWLAHDLLPGEYAIRRAEPLLKRLLNPGRGKRRGGRRLLLLLDGLDEVNAGDISSVLNRVHAFLKGYGEGCRTLLTCREQNYNLLSDTTLLRSQGMGEYRFTDMRDSEVDAMVESRRQDFDARPNRAIPNFLAAIRANPRVFELHRNPLLLTLSIGLYLHRLDDAVPQHRTEFYDESIRHLLRRHDFLTEPGLGKGNRFDYRDKYALLCRFALASMEEALARGVDFEDFRVADLIAAADGLARNLLHIEPNEGRALVMEIQVHAGLITDTGNGETYTFAHRSFHEYCAARELANLGDAGLERLQEHLTQSAWRQTVLFYCGMDHRHAEQVVELLPETGDHAADLNGLALAGHCAAILVRPHIELRLRVVMALGAALSTKDTKGQQPLLLALLELGRDASPEVRATVDEILREHIIREDAAKLSANLGRLGKAALPLLIFMINSENATYQKAALQPVLELEGLEKIDLLWQLLAAFRALGDEFVVLEDEEDAQAARRQLLAEMPAEGAVKRLNDLPVHFQELTEQELRAVYPFPVEGKASANNNFARLLKLEADAIDRQPSPPPYLEKPTNPWERFLALVLGPKTTPREIRDWQNLPADRQRRIWSVPWQWLGRIGVGVGLLAGLWAAVLVLMYGPDELRQLDEAILIATMFTGGTGLAMALLWPLWRGLSRRRGWLGNYGVLSGWPGGLWEGVSWLAPSTSRFRAVARSLGRALRRTLLFSPFVLCWTLVLWVTQPSLEGHGRWVSSVAFAPNGRGILTGSWDHTAILWEAESGAEVRRFRHSRGVGSVAFSPDGRRILTGSWDDTARLWEAGTGQEIRRFEHLAPIISVAFAPDGRKILTGSDDIVRLWDAGSGAEIRRFAHRDWVRSVAFSPDGRRILTGSGDHTVRLWDAGSGQEIRHFQHPSIVASVAFSPDGQQIFTGSWDNTARLWDAETGQEIRRFQHSEDVNSVAFSPDGQQILTGSDDDTARLWDAGSGEEIRRFQHPWGVNSVAFSPDGRTILTGSDDGHASLWDADTGTLLWTSPVPFWNDSTWNRYDILVFAFLVFLFGFFPTIKLFDPGRRLYLGRPNPYLHLYDIPGVTRWLPTDSASRKPVESPAGEAEFRIYLPTSNTK